MTAVVRFPYNVLFERAGEQSALIYTVLFYRTVRTVISRASRRPGFADSIVSGLRRGRERQPGGVVGKGSTPRIYRWVLILRFNQSGMLDRPSDRRSKLLSVELNIKYFSLVNRMIIYVERQNTIVENIDDFWDVNVYVCRNVCIYVCHNVYTYMFVIMFILVRRKFWQIELWESNIKELCLYNFNWKH